MVQSQCSPRAVRATASYSGPPQLRAWRGSGSEIVELGNATRRRAPALSVYGSNRMPRTRPENILDPQRTASDFGLTIGATRFAKWLDRVSRHPMVACRPRRRTSSSDLGIGAGPNYPTAYLSQLMRPFREG